MEKFSYSKIDTYEQCPYKYNLKYNEKIYLYTDNVASMFGSLVHKINEIQTETLKTHKEIDYDMLKDYFVNVDIPKKNKFSKDGDMFGTKKLSEMFKDAWNTVDKTGKTYAQKADEFLSTGIYRQEQYIIEHPELELIGAEIPFEFNYRGYCFRGFIDRLFRYKDDSSHYVIHDIKTSAQAYSDDKLRTPLQFVVYAQALRQKEPDKNLTIDCMYEFPIAGDMKQGGTKGFEERGMKKIDKLLDAIEAKDYTPKPSPLCYWCEFCNNNPEQPEGGHNLCPYYSMWKPDARSYQTKLPWLGMDLDGLQKKKLINLEELENSDDFDI